MGQRRSDARAACCCRLRRLIGVIEIGWRIELLNRLFGFLMSFIRMLGSFRTKLVERSLGQVAITLGPGNCTT